MNLDTPAGEAISPPITRFMPKVDVAPDGCWVWTANRNAAGYGRFGVAIDGKWKCVQAHRWAYEHFVGPIPEGLVLDHLCRNRGCVNPEHLEPVTQQENLRRGEGTAAATAASVAAFAARTECANGHPWNEKNTHIRTDGGRDCRSCWAIYRRNWNERHGTGRRLAIKEALDE